MNVKRGLLKDVSRDELMGMRDAGMTNADIANCLGVTYQTIYHYLGPQPSSIRKKRAPDAPVTTRRQQPEIDASLPELKVARKAFILEGQVAFYKVEGNEKITITSEEHESVGIHANRLDDLIAELRALSLGLAQNKW